MENSESIKSLTQKVESASTNFEMSNTDLKRNYLIWNISSFNIIAKAISVSKGSFGTGYPFYALDENLQGNLPIIQEQLRYSRQLIRDSERVQNLPWTCKKCLEKKYSTMPDLKKICKPCPNMIDKLKPRKIINRLPDIDMWLVCKDGCMEQAQEELNVLLKRYNMSTSDVDPLSSINDVCEISQMLKDNKLPKKFLPIDVHIIEYSKLKELIEKVPEEIKESIEDERKPYLPIHPKSLRKEWQYDDEAYNFVYDYLAAFTPFNFSPELQQVLYESRRKVISEFTPENLFHILMRSATDSTFRRFQTLELEKTFFDRIKSWNLLERKKNEELKYEEDEFYK